MKKRVVVVGAGIMGLSTAFHLAKRGCTDVLVVDRGYLCGGASGRNGGGVRAQFSTETNIRLMQESIAICRDFAAAMKINVWFRQGGYLFLARTPERARDLEASCALQTRCGLPTRLLEPSEARGIVPELDPSGVLLASFNPEDGVLFPWPFLWGYARAARDLGVELATFQEVVGFEREGGRVTAVRLCRTTPGEAPERTREESLVRCDEVVLCTGAWSPEVARLAGVSLPNHPHRHEICSTEPLKPWLGPLVADLTDGLYFSQSMRGEIVGGISVEPVPDGIDQRSSRQFLARYARSLVRAVPRLAGVKVLRQWAGCYDLTPDANPIVGRVDDPENLTLACGFMGHGFMMGPVFGRLLAEHVLTGERSALFQRWSLERYRTGELLTETMIIG
ncbi:MAG: FAD-binding oxidoreductase [Deltaproteobacteria bacterium]|nr:FAD-binding oxidoreductase [Deltaproteobacteria bacterium]